MATGKAWQWSVLLLACGAPAAASGQTQGREAPRQSGQDKDDISVTGDRMPQAEAPRSATCEAMARDPFFAALINSAIFHGMSPPAVFVPTRLPRNPDYSAPPSVPVGSALPDLPHSRFGVRERVYGSGDVVDSTTESVADAGGDTSGRADLTASTDTAGTDDAIAACRGAYMPGGIPPAKVGPPSGAPPGAELFSGPGAGDAGRIDARARIVRNDRTLPMGFALFDQGRYGEALEWFHKAFDRLQYNEGGDEAALFIGKILLLGLGDKSDPVEAVTWLKKAATAPFSPALMTPMFDPRAPERNTASGEAAIILANLYRTGFKGIARDGDESRKWFERAFDVGHVAAGKALGDLYYEGIDTPRDVKKAASWYRRAAKLGLPAAEFALAQILDAGEEGVGQDRKEALGWYQAAAHYEHPGALYALARCYDLGEGVAKDPQRAIGFYKSAALAGNAAAMVSLGTYFYQGELVTKDQAAARKWFEQGAMRSDADGMFDLAAMLMHGEGGDKDLVRAWIWLKRAAQLGHASAPRAIAILEGQMSADQKVAASAALRGG